MTVLQLSPEQAAALRAIKLERDVARLAGALAAVFPEVAARSGERYAGLIAHGVQRGAAQGLDHAACAGRYLACWFALGAAFETRPEHAWARDLLADAVRPQGARAFQLCRGTREELVRAAPRGGSGAAGAPGADAATDPTAFDRAIARLDAMLLPCGTLGSLLPAAPIALGEPCDFDAIDLRLAEPPAGRLPHRYRLPEADAQWHRLPADPPRAALTLRAGGPGLPPRLHVVSHLAERGHARLRVRTRLGRCCDPQVHPLVVLNDAHGVASWRGAAAADLLLDLYAAPEAAADDAPGRVPTDDGPRPVMGRENGVAWGLLLLESCGLRETGPALGTQRAQVAVHHGEQHWMSWRREHGAPMAWPDEGAPPPAPPAARYRVERDGLPLEASRWLAGLQDLDRQLAEGLGRLATAWERESGVADGRLRCEPAVMAGDAALTWGWTEGGEALTDPPCHRLAGTLDLMACQLDLRLSGRLVLDGSVSRLALRCDARAELRTRFERRPADTDVVALTQAARAAFHLPFALEIEALAPAGAGAGAVVGAAGPVAGALVGAAGLRPRPDGAGWQWFCHLAVEPVAVALRLHDPLLGVQTLMRPLLPALTLLDWSLG